MYEKTSHVTSNTLRYEMLLKYCPNYGSISFDLQIVLSSKYKKIKIRKNMFSPLFNQLTIYLYSSVSSSDRNNPISGILLIPDATVDIV